MKKKHAEKVQGEKFANKINFFNVHMLEDGEVASRD
jgi:hypothetical protein